MTQTQASTFRGRDLGALLAEVREHVLRTGRPQETQRGRTLSAGSLVLVWEEPGAQAESERLWSQAAVDSYLAVFVEPRPENAPERLAREGEFVYPYTYAARSRFWDGGWGYVVAAAEATRAAGATVASALGGEEAFLAYLVRAGDMVHLQPLLGVWDWLGAGGMAMVLEEPTRARRFLQRSRIDQLERIVRDVEANPGSRRAVTASFVYPEIDQRLEPTLGVPPYQSFQLLPAPGPREALHSLHLHRSLDASNGVQLDFQHDLRWLRQAAAALDRPVGSVTIVASDFHLYLPSEGTSEHVVAQTTIEEWLAAVTDGYRAGRGEAARRLEDGYFRRNALRIYEKLRQEA